jgi:hypothetical protein
MIPPERIRVGEDGNAIFMVDGCREKTLAETLAPMTEFAFAAWRWPAPGYRIFRGEQLLAEIIKARNSSGWHVRVAAPGFRHLSRLAEIAGMYWRKPEQ